MGQKILLSSFFRSELHFQEETFTANRETCFLRLLAFLGRSSDCCERRKFFTVKIEEFDEVLAAQTTKITSPML